MNKVLFAISLLTFSIFSASYASSIEKIDDEIENQQQIIQNFINHDFPKNIQNTKGAKLAVYHVIEYVRDDHLVSDEMLNDAQKCKNLYLVDFEKKSILLKYLYCLNKDTITFVASYKFENGGWKKVSP